MKGGLPLLVALVTGALTLVGLLFYAPLADLLLGWATFLAAVALLLGVANLFHVHAGRLLRGNVYSAALILSMVAVFALAVTDWLAVTDGAVLTIFNTIQAPMEAALASLLAFFLLFAGVRLLQRRRNAWTMLFMGAAVLFLVGNLPLPGHIFAALSAAVSQLVVTAGMRGILIGVALGVAATSLRLLTGLERPYDTNGPGAEGEGQAPAADPSPPVSQEQ